MFNAEQLEPPIKENSPIGSVVGPIEAKIQTKEKMRRLFIL